MISRKALNAWFTRHGLSIIPDGWKTVPLADIVDLSQYGISSDTGENGPFPLLKMSNISDGKLFVDSVDYCHISFKDIEKYRLNAGDLLFNRTNSHELVGKACLFSGDQVFIAASYLVRFVFKKSVNPEYINYWWQIDIAKHRLKALATVGVSQCNINPTELQKSFYILLPKRHEQDRIVAVFKQWDSSIGLTERLIAAKLELRTWLMQQLLTGKQRLPGFNQPWRTEHLGEMFTNRIETNFHDLPLVAITGSGGVVSREDLVRRDTSNEDKSKYLRICPGDIGYNTMRMWQGVCGLSQLEGIVSPAYTIATPKEDIDGEFMAHLFKSLPVIHLFHRHSQGLVDDTLNLKWRHFAEIKVSIPEKIEQQAIATVFRTADRELGLLRSQLNAFKIQKKELMQQLLTGKIRVLPGGADA